MDLFLNYIWKLATLLNLPRNIHVIMGNEACDLDSTVSSLALAYFIQENENKTNDSITLPLLNVPKDEFKLRIENSFVLNRVGIDPNTLFYKDTLNLCDLVKNHNVKLTLVDHHMLAKDQEFLKCNVISIFDHRPVDLSAKWNASVDVRIKLVGSCTTLITEEIFSKNMNLLSRSLANILYDTIIFDTIGLSPAAGKVKDLDVEMSKKLENFLELNQPDHKELFNVLWTAHNNVSNLTPKQLLIKDLKRADKILVPGLPMAVKAFLKIPNVSEYLKEFCLEKEGGVVILMGLEAKDGVTERDLGFYSLENDKKLLDYVIEGLKQSESLELTEESSNIVGIRYFKQNPKLSRKQLLPLVKNTLKYYEYNKT